MSGPPAGALAVPLDATAIDVEDPAAIAARLPDPEALEAGAAVTLPGVAQGPGGLLRRWRKVRVTRAARCTALLVRGFVGIAADGESVWGVAGEPK